MQLSVHHLVKQNRHRATSLLVLGGLLALVFIGGQLFAWQQLRNMGFSMQSNPANAFFYLITGIHGLHLIGGIWVWARSLLRLTTGATIENIALSIQLCTRYWHFLLLVWLLLFWLLLKT